VAYFLTRVRGALDDREREITRLRRHAEENARFAALGTLAAGTAHELATPLGTIAVIAGELEGGSAAAVVAAEAAAIQAEVARCRDILTKMQAGAARAKGDGARAPVGAAVRRGIEAWERAHPEAQVTLNESVGHDAVVALSADDVEAAICALLDNALYATQKAESTEAISIEIAEEHSAIKIVVEDRGTGIAPELRERLGEPFLTTKQPGEGMGLGLYLIRMLLAQVGGRLEVAAREPRGTRITLCLAEVGA
jgi:two-component system sensor histidine kinase RegB